MSTIIEQLTEQHLKKDFDCGYSLLNNYLQKQAKQDIKRDLSACYVMTKIDSLKIIGYYTLSGNAINRNDLPEEIKLKLPLSYSNLPTVLLGRLAIDTTEKGKGYGQKLLADALKRCVSISKKIGLIAVIVDPIDELAISFYKNYGFITIPSNNKMFLPIKTIEKAL
jgi:ribosomal protein S18 acetylase RimI-like enzyme